jgi:hypothetical protein
MIYRYLYWHHYRTPVRAYTTHIFSSCWNRPTGTITGRRGRRGRISITTVNRLRRNYNRLRSRRNDYRRIDHSLDKIYNICCQSNSTTTTTMMMSMMSRRSGHNSN